MLSYLMELVRSCGPLLRRAGELSISAKEGPRNFVTSYDVQVQNLLREKLLARWPDAHFVGEEGGAQDWTLRGLAFIADPIDGTTNFIKDYRASAVSLAAVRDGQAVGGVVYDPYTDSLFAAEKGRGATLNGRAIRASDSGLDDSLVCIGMSPYYPDETERTFVLARALFEQALDLRRSGSAALDLCYVACGRAGLMLELRLSPWDHAAAGLILAEAGGKITDMAQKPLPLDRPSAVVAGGPRAWKDFFAKGLDRL